MIETIITGCNGFVGQRLVKRFPNAVHLVHDGTGWGQWHGCGQVFFLSTYGNMATHTDYTKIIKANVADLIHCLSSCTDWFCFMSTSSVLLPIQTPYARTKRAAEEILLSLPELKSCIVRPYSITGVGEQKEHLIPTLIRSCMEGEPMTFDPEPVHDFIDVEDVVDGLIALSESKATGIHEFGNGCCHRNESVRRAVEDATGKRANIVSVKRLRSYDNTDWCCRNKSEFCNPKKSLEQSISEMVEAYKREHA